MDPETLLASRSRETTIRRDAQGVWFDGVERVLHPSLTRAFDRWVQRAADGRYCLKNDVNWAYVTLEGPPFFVRSARVGAGGEVTLELSGDLQERLDPSTLRQGPDGSLYCDVRGGLCARFDRCAMQQLEDVLREDEQGVYLALGARRVRPPLVHEPLDGVRRAAP